MSNDSHKVYGLAVLDYFNGDASATLVAYDESGEKRAAPVSLFFREPSQFPPWEKKAIELCRGRVLDVGAGAGRHSLALQERELEVCAIEIVPECVEVMKKRGVKQARCADIFSFEADAFDTALCLMNGMTVVGGMNRLQKFFDAVKRLIKLDGQLLIDSTDLRDSPRLPSLLEESRQKGPYFGEMKLQLEYKGNKGEPFTELYIDPDTLAEQALKAGWSCEVVLREATGRYLARLTLIEQAR